MIDDRPLICRTGELFSRETVHQAAEGLDVTSSRGFEVHERQLMFVDVHLVTLHGDRGVVYLVVTGVFGFVLLALAIFIIALDQDMLAVSIPFFVMGVPAVVAFLVRLVTGRETVTVHGRRSKAVLRFSGLRKKRAREVYGVICAAVRRGQNAGSAISDRESAAPPLPDSVFPPRP